MGSEPWDVVIVGGGAAGCAAAIHLPAGVRALLVDRGNPAAGRCCGGLLNPDAQRTLAQRGLAVPETVRVRPEPQVVHALDLDAGRTQTYRRAYWNLDRARFDAWLLGRAAERVTLRLHARVVGLRTDGTGLAVGLASADGDETIRTRRVIGADGAGSRVRRLAFPDRPAPPVMTAIQVRLPPAAGLDRHEVLFASRLTTYYAWAIPKPDGVLVGAAFSRLQGMRDRFAEILAHFRERLDLAGEERERSARRLTRPERASHVLAGSGRVLLAGEAAGLVSPSSGEGLSFAVESGAAAGAALSRPEPEVVYRRTFEPLAKRIGRKRLKARVIFSPTLRRWALRLPWCP